MRTDLENQRSIHWFDCDVEVYSWKLDRSFAWYVIVDSDSFARNPMKRFSFTIALCLLVSSIACKMARS